MAERTVTQARQALESYLQAARRTSESMEQTSDKVQAGTKDMAQKTLSAVEQNLRASLDYAQRLVRAKALMKPERREAFPCIAGMPTPGCSRARVLLQPPAGRFLHWGSCRR